MIKQWQCAGCDKVWEADEEPLECECGCRIIKEVQEVEPPAAPSPIEPPPVETPPVRRSKAWLKWGIVAVAVFAIGFVWFQKEAAKQAENEQRWRAAEEARQVAEKRAADEAEARRVAEKKAADDAAAKRAAERRAADEAEARRIAEKKAADDAAAKRAAEKRADDEAEARRIAAQKAADEAEARRAAERQKEKEEARQAAERERLRRTTPAGEIKSMTTTHNVVMNNQRGLQINITFQVDNMLNKQGGCAVFFNFANGVPLRDMNGLYGSPTGQVSVQGNFMSKYQNTAFSDYRLFIPYPELHLPNGTHNLKVNICLFDHNGVNIATEWFDFPISLF